jgi:hypothetical protein
MPTFSAAPIVAALIALLSFALLFRLVFADVSGSGNFQVNQSVNDFGGAATSSSFQSITTGGQIVTGEASSTSFQLATGYEYFDSFAPKQENWRWYDDETDEMPNTALEAENVAPVDVFNDNIIKLRMVVKETAGIGQEGAKYKVQFSTVDDFSSGVHDVTERAICNGSSVWCYANGSGADNAVISTSLISGADSCSGGVGNGCGTHNESGISTTTFTQVKNSTTEYEFTLVSKDSVSNTVYFFRLFDVAASSAVPLDSGKSYPSLSTQGGTLSFSIAGLPSSTSAGGATTNIDSSATAVPFGTLPIGTPIIGAQRLNVSTNASKGFEIYAYQNQGLVGDGGQQISPVAATNDSPAGWSSACTTSAPGCFGYHTDEPVLAGGSTRFAADDTYAKFTQFPSEIAYSGTPVSDHNTDVVYKVEAHDLQAAGDYTTNVTYIVVPVF